MRAPRTLRDRLALVFAGAVLGTMLLHGALVTGVLVTDEWLARCASPAQPETEGLFDEGSLSYARTPAGESVFTFRLPVLQE